MGFDIKTSSFQGNLQSCLLLDFSDALNQH